MPPFYSALRLTCAGGLLLFFCACNALDRAGSDGGFDLARARHEAAHKPRRIIMNNDGNDCIVNFATEEYTATPQALLARRTTPLLGSQVDAIFYCTGVFNVYTNHSGVTEMRDHLYGERRTFASELYANCGKDPLTIMIEFCRKHEIEIFWSMRMNDTHDSSRAYRELMAQWKKDHPELLMGREGERFAAGNGRWSAVNYGEPEVREKVYRILEDVITRYDIDGVELDFFRHPVYFKSQMLGGRASHEECEAMTALVARVRALCDRVAKRTAAPDPLGRARAGQRVVLAGHWSRPGDVAKGTAGRHSCRRRLHPPGAVEELGGARPQV
ncbi:family 10 glycosylhydrolase [bacterium]|nr:family 10 glycosylhydrolase [bacterium]